MIRFMMKRAFSLLEILLVFGILGILALLGYAWFPDSKLHLAQNQIIAHLNYTRFLSLSSVKQITQGAFCQSDHCKAERERWSESLWRLQFSSASRYWIRILYLQRFSASREHKAF